MRALLTGFYGCGGDDKKEKREELVESFLKEYYTLNKDDRPASDKGLSVTVDSVRVGGEEKTATMNIR